MDIVVVGEALVDIYCVADGRARRMDEEGLLERHLGGAPAIFHPRPNILGNPKLRQTIGPQLFRRL